MQNLSYSELAGSVFFILKNFKQRERKAGKILLIKIWQALKEIIGKLIFGGHVTIKKNNAIHC